jgi:hypothetical protein
MLTVDLLEKITIITTSQVWWRYNGREEYSDGRWGDWGEFYGT